VPFKLTASNKKWAWWPIESAVIKPGLPDFDILVQGFETVSADRHPNRLSIAEDSGLLQIGPELTICFSLRETHIVPELWLFAAHFTYCHFHIAF
jgi:hypothetical protein